MKTWFSRLGISVPPSGTAVISRGESLTVIGSPRVSAGHAETRGEPITVSDSPLLITAVPEGGTLIPSLENQVFILTSYPDGSPANTELTVRAAGNPDQHVVTDDSGVAFIRIHTGTGTQT